MRTIIGFRTLGFLALAAAAALSASTAMAITVTIDYTTDTNNFFGDGNPQGAAAGTQAKDALDAAAEFYSGILEDTFGAIDVPDKFYGSLGGEATWFWKRRFNNPTTGLNNAALNIDVDENQYVVFVGARDLPGTALGLGGPGGFVINSVSKNGQFTSQENTQISQMQTEFSDAVTDRGETSGFGHWGGSISFDRPTTWHFNHTTAPAAGTRDFFSVALHELAHTLGFGAVDDDDTTDTPWEDLVSGTEFTGANALAAYVPAENVPLESADDQSHWNSTIEDGTVYGSDVAQEPLMTPDLGPSVRHVLTDLDAAALADIGWEIDLSEGAAASALVDGGDAGGTILSNFSSNSSISGSAITLSLVAYGVPEPSSLLLFVMGGLFTLLANSRRNR